MVRTHRIAQLSLVASLIMAIFSSIAIEAPPVSSAQARVFRLEEATIADIQAAFAVGALTCRQLTQLYLNRIRAYDDVGPAINSIITINPRALETAAAL